MPKKYKNGVVIGKFWPPHKGHKYLIDTAEANCKNLYVIVCANRFQNIPGYLRAQWIKEIHPNVNVILKDDEGYDEDDSKLWARLVIAWLGFIPDIAFTSATYGQAWADAMGCPNIDIDIPTRPINCTGTQVRAEPKAWMDFLEPCVQEYFRAMPIPKVVVLGAESTGTTTLSKALAKVCDAPWVPEYGRIYSEQKLKHGTFEQPWKSEEFLYIANEQAKLEYEASIVALRENKKFVICDTDPFATAIWEERYLGRTSQKLKDFIQNRNYLLYILTAPDIPFVQDGLRDGEHIRLDMHQRFLEELAMQSAPYILVEGSLPNRLKNSLKAINSHLTKPF